MQSNYSEKIKLNTMPADNQIHIGKLLLAVSEAMELISPLLHMHQQRTAYIAWQTGLALQLDPQALMRLFTAALIHDIGALTPEEKLALHQFEEVNPERHCILGAMLFHQISWLEPSAETIRCHHKAWQTWELQQASGASLEAQIILAADVLERLLQRDRYVLHQVGELHDRLRRFSGSLLAPEVVEAVLQASRMEAFWLDLTSPYLSDILRRTSVFEQLSVPQASLNELSLMLRGVIDFRSAFTAAHSAGVAECASALALKAGFDGTQVERLHMAGNMHDVGKLAVPNKIVEKRGRLTRRQYAVMRQHAYYTYVILGALDDFGEARQWAAQHHERLDGSGYPFGLSGDKISTGARIMAVADMYTALTETRPYRTGMPENLAAGLLKSYAHRGLLDAWAVNTLLSDYAEITSNVHSVQEQSYHHYAEAIQPYVSNGKTAALAG